jgi:predicted neuraminidase
MNAARDAVRAEHLLVPPQPRYPMSHAPYLAELDGERLMVVWFAGTREWAKDVQVLCAVHTPRTDQWGPVHDLVSDIGYSLGNSVLLRDEGGLLHLWYVRTRGYWHDGEIVHMVWQDFEGGYASKDVVPLARGWMVRGRPIVRGPVAYLPVYHELELVSAIWEQNLVTGAGRLREAMQGQGGLIHPTLVEISAAEFRCFLRNPRAPNRIHFAYSMDRGATWSRAFPTALPNPNSGLDVLRLEDAALLCAYNDSERHRYPLSLARSESGGVEWRKLGDLEVLPGEYSYPSLLRTRHGVHLAYSFRREAVKVLTLDAERL